MKVRDIMNINSVRILNNATMAEAAELAAISNASGLFVVNDDNDFIGVLSEGDMMAKALPDIAEIMASSGGIQDSQEIFSQKGADIGREHIKKYLVDSVITIDPDDNVLKAASTMAMKKMRRLPVVKNGKLVGTISRGDICKAVMTA